MSTHPPHPPGLRLEIPWRGDPANIVTITEHCLNTWRRELGDLEGLAPWITDTQLDHWSEAWADEKATR